jgi:hypothetical protein
VIGIIGPKTHGKSWVAGQLGLPVMGLADPIKALVDGLYVGDKDTLRPHYIRIGMAARAIDPDVWVKALATRRPASGWLPHAVCRAYGLDANLLMQVLRPDELKRAGSVDLTPRTGVVVDDVRFANEAERMDRVILVCRHEPEETEDVTENGWRLIHPDWAVVNDAYAWHDVEEIRRHLEAL